MFEKRGVPSAYVVFQGIGTCIGLLTNTICLMFIIKKLSLNNHIKRILIIDTVAKMILLFLSLIGYISVYILDWRILYTCAASFFPLLLAYMGSFLFPMTMTVVRYHMACRVADNRMIDHSRIKILTWSMTVLFVTSSFLGSYVVYNHRFVFGPAVEICAVDDDLGDSPGEVLAPVLTTCLAVILVSISVCYDIKMARFLKERRNKVQPYVMSLWSNHRTLTILWNQRLFQSKPPFLDWSTFASKS